MGSCCSTRGEGHRLSDHSPAAASSSPSPKSRKANSEQDREARLAAAEARAQAEASRGGGGGKLSKQLEQQNLIGPGRSGAEADAGSRETDIAHEVDLI
ncbi:hypothetical protein HK104_000341 [Borealophlyctis nickersoniae]|nr:hypothetical protein HK104_000341 [Borealophlyctis nickersoniae]